ncbi:MAG TPA: Atxe2 family lasso peptide isopeptidase [Pyrinomonadaceae bacterium]
MIIKNLFLLLVLCCVWNLLGLTSNAQQSPDGSADLDPSVLEIRSVPPSTPRAITSMDLLTIRDVRGLQISPDGKSVVFALAQAVYETNRYRTALLVVGTTPGSTPIRLGSPGPPRWDVVGAFRPYVLSWSPDSRFILCLIEDKGRRQIWRWKRDGGNPEQLTHSSEDVEDYEWSPDRTKIIFTTREPLDPSSSKVLQEGFLYDGSIRLWGGSAFPQLLLESKPRNTHTWVFEFKSGVERRATKEEEASYTQAHTAPDMGPEHFVRGMKISPDRTSEAFIVTDPDANDSIWVKPVSGGKPAQVSPAAPGYISELWWSKDSDQIYFTQLRDDRSALLMVSAKGGTVREASKASDFLYSFSFNQDQTLVACVRYNATLPPEIAVLDLATGAVRTLVDVNPEFKNIRLSPATKLEWTNTYGHKTYGYLVKPLDYEPGKRYPLIITTYAAGAFLRGAVGDEYPIQVFAANGFAVLDFSAPHDKLIQNGDFKKALMRWNSPMESLAAGIKILEDQGIIDSNLKGLSGLSYGAEITEYTISHSDLFQAAITSGPGGRDPLFYDLAEKSSQKLLSDWWGLGRWWEAAQAERWRELSPALNARRIKAPLLINVADSEVLPTLMLWNSLKDLNKPVEMFVYADESHIKHQPRHRYEIYERNLDWFNFWLRGKENVDTAKHQQYERWKAMREAAKKEQTALSSHP